MTTILAIDPGLSGALALSDGRELIVHDLPTTIVRKHTRLDLVQLADLVGGVAGPLADLVGGVARPVEAVVEQVGSMPMQGTGSAFNFGFTTGAIHGVLTAMGYTVHTVTPQQWKFGVGLNAVPGQDQKARKNASRARACELFPEHKHLFSRVKDDGRAEAALMAWWFVNKSGKTAMPKVLA